MGIFTRFRDIISSNINVMLDKAEDPEKLIKLMIREMEDTLVEIKASCAGVMANSKKVQRQLDEVQSREKRGYSDRADALKQELIDCDSLVEQYQDDIRQLEDKLGTARERQRILVQRHIHANRKKRAQEDIRRMDSTEAIIKFEELENRIERMEAEADLVNFGRKPTLEGELDTLALDEEIEKELQSLKSSLTKKDKNTRKP